MAESKGSRQGWLAIATALAIAAFGLALIGIRGEIASADQTAEASRTSTVVIDDFAYHPPTLTIGAGSKVIFSNTDRRAHTATRRGSFSTGRIRPGKAVSVRFNRRGTFRYHCAIHPFMKGKIVVN